MKGLIVFFSHRRTQKGYRQEMYLNRQRKTQTGQLRLSKRTDERFPRMYWIFEFSDLLVPYIPAFLWSIKFTFSYVWAYVWFLQYMFPPWRFKIMFTFSDLWFYVSLHYIETSCLHFLISGLMYDFYLLILVGEERKQDEIIIFTFY